MTAAAAARRHSEDPRLLLLHAPMSRFQWIAIAIIGLLYTLDGFDVMAMSFAAPVLLTEWRINKAELGYALSAGLFGMAIGSILLSPVADAIGRRRVLLSALGMMIVGTAWTSLSETIWTLAASRLLTGLGIGAMLGVATPLVAEYTNAHRRDFAVSLTSTAFALGAILGGLLSVWLLSTYGWRAIFQVATGLDMAMMILAALYLLEPLEMVVARPGRNGLARANAYLRRCGHAPIAALPLLPADRKFSLIALFSPGMAKQTLVLTLLYFCYMIPLFYMQTWTPALIVALGLPASKAAAVSAAMSYGGATAGVVVATASQRIGLKRLEAILLCVAAATMVMFVKIPGQFGFLLAGAVATGFFVMGSMVGLWAIIVRIFPASLRASGTGFVLGIGRLGSALSPILAGLLFAGGFGRFSVTLLMATPLLVSLALLATLQIRPEHVG